LYSIMSNTACNPFSESAWDFIRDNLGTSESSSVAAGSLPTITATSFVKDAVMYGPGGALWDTDMNAEGNMTGWGGLLGNVGGGTAGTIATSWAGPGAIAGGAAGGAAGGMAGRGVGGFIGRQIDRFNPNAQSLQGADNYTWKQVGADAAFGSLGGLGKGVSFARAALSPSAATKTLAKGLQNSAVAKGTAAAGTPSVGFSVKKLLNPSSLLQVPNAKYTAAANRHLQGNSALQRAWKATTHQRAIPGVSFRGTTKSNVLPVAGAAIRGGAASSAGMFGTAALLSPLAGKAAPNLVSATGRQYDPKNPLRYKAPFTSNFTAVVGTNRGGLTDANYS
jgi:hypothetical protein